MRLGAIFDSKDYEVSTTSSDGAAGHDEPQYRNGLQQLSIRVGETNRTVHELDRKFEAERKHNGDRLDKVFEELSGIGADVRVLTALREEEGKSESTAEEHEHRDRSHRVNRVLAGATVMSAVAVILSALANLPHF